MAKPDHTAPVRPSASLDLGPRPPNIHDDHPYPRALASGRRQTYVARRAGTDFARFIVRQLLDHSGAFHHAKSLGETPEAWQFPLTGEQANGLHAALHYLGCYVDGLGPEPENDDE